MSKILSHFCRRRKRRLLLLVLICLFLGGVRTLGTSGAERLECNTITLPASVLPGVGSLRIAFLADIHGNRRLFEKAIRMVKEAKPDIILLGGDFIMVDQRFKRTRWAVEGLKKLRAVAPVYAVWGNQDYEKQEQVQRVFDTAGIPLLRNESIEWTTPGGKPLRLVGLGDWNEGDEKPEQCMKAPGEESLPVLLLSHDPESRHLLKDYDWDLMLAGHTHGGQLGNPFTRRFCSFRSDMPSGLFSYEGNRRIFVTRGVGAILGMRFFCPPEVNIIELR